MSVDRNTTEELPKRKFDLRDHVWVCQGESECYGLVFGFEDGRRLGRLQKPFTGWAYHVEIQRTDGNTEKVIVSEEDLRRLDEE